MLLETLGGGQEEGQAEDDRAAALVQGAHPLLPCPSCWVSGSGGKGGAHTGQMLGGL